MKYGKLAANIDDQLGVLHGRGLAFSNLQRAQKYLSTVGYFRLTGYMSHLQTNDGSHTFHKDVDFDNILNLYSFDKKLRGIILDYIERIEIAVRAFLNDKFISKYGFFWYFDENLYSDNSVYQEIVKFLDQCYQDEKEGFVRTFKRKYTSESKIPSNMGLELLTFGKLSRLYKGLKNGQEKQEIAKIFGQQSTILSSWLVYINNVRNICAHHSRLWNKKVTVDRPVIPSRKEYKFNGDITTDFNTTMYGIISIIERLLKAFNPVNNFTSKIEQLITGHSIDTQLMGFPIEWKESAPWRQTI